MCLLFQAFLITSLNTIFFSAILAPATGGLFGAPTPGESFHWQIDTTIFSKILTIYFVSYVAPAAGGLFGAPAAPAPAFGGSLFGAPGKIKYPHVTLLSMENTTKFSFSDTGLSYSRPYNSCCRWWSFWKYSNSCSSCWRSIWCSW